MGPRRSGLISFRRRFGRLASTLGYSLLTPARSFQCKGVRVNVCRGMAGFEGLARVQLDFGWDGHWEFLL